MQARFGRTLGGQTYQRVFFHRLGVVVWAHLRFTKARRGAFAYHCNVIQAFSMIYTYPHLLRVASSFA